MRGILTLCLVAAGKVIASGALYLWCGRVQKEEGLATYLYMVGSFQFAAFVYPRENKFL